jgi:P-type E1-E2 ATPase
MISFQIPGHGEVRLAHAVLDVNGTLARDGALLEGVAGRLAALRARLQVHLLTADTHGRQAEIDAALGFNADRLRVGEPEDAQKAAYVATLGAASVVAIGNGANDAGMLRVAAIGIAVIGPEGAARVALEAADIVTTGPLAALDLLLNERRLVATLRR